MMNLLFNLINRLTARTSEERGEVSIEYVLVAGLLAIAIIGGMAVLTPVVGTWFASIAASVTAAMP